ncbi:MAG: hypothetical protein M0Z37_01740 [Nitrospiraceae bacterium]|nr:hypothetical protein [Nitrospiraceae bacterium]
MVMFMGVRLDREVRIQQKPFDAYASERFSRFAHSAQLLSGEKLRQAQNSESLPALCGTIQCESREAHSLHLTHFLDIHISKASTPGALFMTLSIWKARPLTLERMVSRRFLVTESAAFDALPSAMDELLSARGLYFPLKDIQPESDPGESILHLIARGETERAVSLGKANINNQVAVHSPVFFTGYFEALVLSGQPEEAIRIGEMAIHLKEVTPQLIVGLRRLEKDLGHPGRARSVLYRGLAELPDSEVLWSYIIEDQVRRNNSREALRLAALFMKKHPGKKISGRMSGAIYSAYVFSDEGTAADQWGEEHNIMKSKGAQTGLAKHAILFRLLQKGHYEDVVLLARKWILKGETRADIFQDLMIAEGALNEPISEARTARNAIASGQSNPWILNRLSDLAARGY